MDTDPTQIKHALHSTWEEYCIHIATCMRVVPLDAKEIFCTAASPREGGNSGVSVWGDAGEEGALREEDRGVVWQTQ